MAQNREQEKVDSHQPEAPLLCINNCGFFGCATTMNLCSRCYKDLHVKMDGRVDENAMAVSALGNTTVAAMVNDGAISGSNRITSLSLEPATTQNKVVMVPGLVAGPSVSSPSATKQVLSTGSTRCISCRKRVGLLGFNCKCGGVFCSLHRYSDKHGCTFDYKSAGRDAIARANPLVKAEKIEKL